jgi:hypothetical protein
MIIVFEKGTNKIVGMAPEVFDNGKMRDYKQEELFPKIDHSKHGSIFVKDSPEYMDPGKEWQLKLDKAGNPTGLEAKNVLTIVLTTNAQDKDNDGIAEILVTEDISDRSRTWENCEIRVQLMEGNKKANKELDVKLNTNSGTFESKLLKTDSKGAAKTSFRAGTDTVFINITATAEGARDGYLQLEVLPVKDFESFHGKVISK